MAKNWYSLRPHEIKKHAKRLGFTRLSDVYFEYFIRNMPEPTSIIGDKNWTGTGNWMIKLNEVNHNWMKNSKLSPWQNGKETAGGKEVTYEVPSGKIVSGKPVFTKIRFRKSGKLTRTVAGTAEQERGSAFIFRRALNENATWRRWQDIVDDDETYPELVRIFDGSVPESWLISYFAQHKVLLDDVKPASKSEFNRDGGFMQFITNLVKEKKFGAFSQKDTWNPADIWIIKGDQQQLIRVIERCVRGPGQTILELNAVLRSMYHRKSIMGISLKKTGAIAHYEEVNLDGFIRGLNTENYNYAVSMKDFVANFTIDSGTDMFTQDVKINVETGAPDNKTFTFQIKALDSGSSGGQNLKFEPTMKGAGSARLGKAPVDEVVGILKGMPGGATFVNKYQDYPKDLVAFQKKSNKFNKTYYEGILRTLLPKITADMSNVDDVIKSIEHSFGSTKDKGTNTRCKLMGLEFFYQVSKLSDTDRNEFITDMVFLAQKKAFSKKQYFGPFGKIY